MIAVSCIDLIGDSFLRRLFGLVCMSGSDLIRRCISIRSCKDTFEGMAFILGACGILSVILGMLGKRLCVEFY